MDNKEVLNESFFKLFKKEKPTYIEKLKDSFSKYSPVDPKTRKAGSYNDGLNLSSNDSFSIKDTGEIKKRLSGTFGAAFGNNTVKSLASRSVKKFPIIISDAVDPNTAILVKKLLEEQVAEYINLLVSNQVIDLSSFAATDTDSGNIAMRALDKLATTSFSRQDLADKAKQNMLSSEDIFASAPLLYSLIRHEDCIHTGNELLDTLMESAVILPSEHVEAYEKVLNAKLAEESFKDYYSVDLKNSIMINEETGSYSERVAEFLKMSDADLSKLELNQGELVRIRKELEGYDKLNPEDQKNYVEFVARLEVAKNKEIFNIAVTSFSNNVRHLIDARKKELQAELKGNPAPTGKPTNEPPKSEEPPKPKFSKADLLTSPLRNSTYAQILTGSHDLFGGLENEIKSNNLLKDRIASVRDRYSKAVILLETQRISGFEFIDYCALRLGIPISKADRRNIAIQYPATRIRSTGRQISKVRDSKGQISEDETYFYISDNEADNLYIQRVAKLNKTILDKPIINNAIAAGAAAGTGSIVGGIGLAAGAGVAPVVALVLGGAALGFGTAKLIMKILNKKPKDVRKGREGWERVEYLIEQLDKQMYDVHARKELADRRLALIQNYEKEIESRKKNLNSKNNGNDGYKEYAAATSELKALTDSLKFVNDNEVADQADLEKAMNKIVEQIEILAKEATKASEKTQQNTQAVAEDFYMPDELKQSLLESEAEFDAALNEEFETNPEFRAEILSEAVISLSSPVDLKTKSMPVAIKKIAYDPEAEMVLPSFGKTATYAYGSVQYDRKENKDRRFNAPLILKVSFNSKFSDGKATDNELTAVIGILGVVTRVPSEEMKYILKSNAEGVTISGILRGDKKVKDTIGDILAGTKLKKEIKNLPQSAEIWANLEKVAALAVANKLRGSDTNNVSNAHLVFAQKEIDELRGEYGIDYIRGNKISSQLLKRYSALSLMIANDSGERMYIFDDIDNISWNVVPYAALQSHNNNDSSLVSALSRLERGRI